MRKTDNIIRSNCSVKRGIVTALMLPFPLLFSFSASFKNSNPREKVAKLSSFWNWWTKSLFVSIIVAKYNIFPALTMAARAKKKILAKRFAHAFSVYYRDFEHAYVY